MRRTRDGSIETQGARYPYNNEIQQPPPVLTVLRRGSDTKQPVSSPGTGKIRQSRRILLNACAASMMITKQKSPAFVETLAYWKTARDTQFLAETTSWPLPKAVCTFLFLCGKRRALYVFLTPFHGQAGIETSYAEALNGECFVTPLQRNERMRPVRTPRTRRANDIGSRRARGRPGKRGAPPNSVPRHRRVKTDCWGELATYDPKLPPPDSAGHHMPRKPGARLSLDSCAERRNPTAKTRERPPAGGERVRQCTAQPNLTRCVILRKYWGPGTYPRGRAPFQSHPIRRL